MQSPYDIAQVQRRRARYGQVYRLESRVHSQADESVTPSGSPNRMSSLNGQPPASVSPAGNVNGARGNDHADIAHPPFSANEGNNTDNAGHSQNSRSDSGVELPSISGAQSFSTPMGSTPHLDNNANHIIEQMANRLNNENFQQINPDRFNIPVDREEIHNGARADLPREGLLMQAGPAQVNHAFAQHVHFPPNPVSSVIHSEAPVPPYNNSNLPNVDMVTRHWTLAERQEIGQRLREEYEAFMQLHYLEWVRERGQALKLAGIEVPSHAMLAQQLFPNSNPPQDPNEQNNGSLDRSRQREHRDFVRSQRSRSRDQIRERNRVPASVTPAPVANRQDGINVPVTRPSALNIQVDNNMPYVAPPRRNTPRQRENDNENRPHSGISSQMQNLHLRVGPSGEQDGNWRVSQSNECSQALDLSRMNLQGFRPGLNNQPCRYENGCGCVACVREAHAENQIYNLASNAEIFGQPSVVPPARYQVSQGVPRQDIPDPSAFQSVQHANRVANHPLNNFSANQPSSGYSINQQSHGYSENQPLNGFPINRQMSNYPVNQPISSFLVNRYNYPVNHYANNPAINQPPNHCIGNSQVRLQSTSSNPGKYSLQGNRRQTQSSPDSYLLKNLELPKYSGPGDRKTPYDFLCEIEKYGRIAGISYYKLLDRIQIALTDDAAYWYEKQMLWNPFSDWNDFRARFRERFQPHDYREKLNIELQLRRQGEHEPLPDFLRVISGYYERLDNFDELAVIRDVLKKMQTSYKLYLSPSSQFQSLAEFSEIVDNVEKMVQQDKCHREPQANFSIEPRLAYKPHLPVNDTQQVNAQGAEVGRNLEVKNSNTEPRITTNNMSSSRPIGFPLQQKIENRAPTPKNLQSGARSPSPGRSSPGPCFGCGGPHLVRSCPNKEQKSPTPSTSLNPKSLATQRNQ